MWNIKRSLAVVLLVVMVFSCFQNVLVPTFSADVVDTEPTDVATTEPSETTEATEAPTESTETTVVTEPVESESTEPSDIVKDEYEGSTEPNETTEVIETEPTEVIETEPTEPQVMYHKMEAEVDANVFYFADSSIKCDDASNGYVVGGHEIESVYQLELFDDLASSSLSYIPHVKYNVSASSTGMYDIIIAARVEKVGEFEDFYIPVVVEGNVYKAIAEDYAGEDGIYIFSATVKLTEGKNSVLCIPFDAETYLELANYQVTELPEACVSFDYLGIPEGVSALEKDKEPEVEPTEPPTESTEPTAEPTEPATEPTISVEIPELLPEGGVADEEVATEFDSPSTLGKDDEDNESGAIGGVTGNNSGLNNPGKGTGLQSTYVGVTMQVVYYYYKDVYNADKMYAQICNSVKNYDTSSDKAMNSSGQKLDASAAGLQTIFSPFYLTKKCYFLNSYTAAGGVECDWGVYELSSYPDNFPVNKTWNTKYPLESRLFKNSSAKVTDTSVANFFQRILRGSSKGAWDISDVASNTSLYAKVLKELGVSDTHIQNYLDAYNGKLSLIDSTDKNTLIPVIIWKMIVQQSNYFTSDTTKGEAWIFTPADVALPTIGESNIPTWWKTDHKWDYVAEYQQYTKSNGDKIWVYNYNSTDLTKEGYKQDPHVVRHLYDLDTAHSGTRCLHNTSRSYACKIFFGTGHGVTGHGDSAYSWSNVISDSSITGAGYINVIPSTGYDAGQHGKNAWHFRNYWAPFGVGSGNVTIEKVSSEDSDTKLSGAQFKLYKSWDATNGYSDEVTDKDYKNNTAPTTDIGYEDAATRTTNGSGKISYTNLRSGTYYLREVIAPTGYVLSSTPKMIAIVNGKTTTETVKNTPSGQPFTLKKVSSASSTIQLHLVGNDMYSLAGAVYEVRVNGVLKETLTTGSNGQVTSENKYPAGTKITVTEKSAPCGYKIVSTPYEFTISSTASNNVFEVSDPPVFDPQSLVFWKIDSVTGAPQGGASFEGAVFKWEYFDNTTWSGTATRTWYFATDADGFYGYDSDYIAKGYTSSSLYKDSNGAYKVPLGSIKITEVKAPAGYRTMPVLYATITQKTNGGNADFDWTAESLKYINTADGGYELEEPINTLGSIKVQKVDKETISTPQGDVQNFKAKFKVFNQSSKPVKIGDYPVADPGEVCYEFWTNEKGYYESGSIFPIGNYVIREDVPPVGMLLDPMWSKTFSVTATSYVFDFTIQSCKDPVIRGGFSLVKLDEDYANNGSIFKVKGQGSATLQGATFNVINKSGHPVKVNNRLYQVDDVCYTFSVDSNGAFTSPSNLLPYGTYTVVEASAGTGYLIDEDWSATFKITSEGEIVEVNSKDNNPVKEPVIRGGIEVHKVDNDRPIPVPQGGASLQGAVLKVTNVSSSYVYTDRDGDGNYAWYTPGSVCLYITTDENGVAKSAADALPYGKYRISELSAPEGYKVNTGWYANVDITEDGVIVPISGDNSSLKEPVIRGGVKIVKYDGILLWDTDENCKLDGISFSIYNNTGSYVFIGDTSYENGECVATLALEWVESEGKWIAQSANNLLPYGDYIVRENKAEGSDSMANLYYSWAAREYHFSIVEDGVIVDTDVNNNAIEFENMPVARIELLKVNPRNETLTGVVFKLEWSEDGVNWLPVVYSEDGNPYKGATTSPVSEGGLLATDENGVAIFEGLYSLVQYRVTEVSTLDGYLLLTEPVFTGTITPNENGELKIAYRVVNTDVLTLPMTGSMGMAIMSTLSSIPATMSFVALAYFKKKEKEEG